MWKNLLFQIIWMVWGIIKNQALTIHVLETLLFYLHLGILKDKLV